MQLPREIIVGGGSLNSVGKICNNLGFSNILIITGPTTINVAGKRVANKLRDIGFKINCQIVTTNNPTLDDIVNSEKKIKKYKPQAVLGIGGGTKTDIAKLSSARQRIPFISIPTTASHDGMASPFASIKGLERPYSVKAQSPIAVIADTDIIARTPYRFIASGCADVISKLTSTRDWKLAYKRNKEYYANYATNLALMSAQHILENVSMIKPRSEEGVRILLESLVSCGVAMCIGGTSKPCSGSEHLFSHALNILAPDASLHGERCGLGTIMMAALHGMDWEIIRDTLKRIGAPVTAKDIGINAEFIVKALVMAPKIRPERYTILNENPLSYESSFELAKKTGIID
jgi:glycerol-1-phosphate dehydrogenase [NAD(P)+]